MHTVDLSWKWSDLCNWKKTRKKKVERINGKKSVKC